MSKCRINLYDICHTLELGQQAALEIVVLAEDHDDISKIKI